MNKIGTPGWWLFGKVLRRKHISKPMLKIFDKTVWIWRRIDPCAAVAWLVADRRGKQGIILEWTRA